jgi:hypothetical protein
VADDWQRFSWRYSGGAGRDSRFVFLYWVLHLDSADMSYIKSIKHPVVAAAMIFYAIGFLVGYGMGKI